MIFPIKIVKKRLFIRYNKRWKNIYLEIVIHGGGIKGFFRFAYNWIKCIFGKHIYGSYASFVKTKEDGLEFVSYRACMYCHKNKDNYDE